VVAKASVSSSESLSALYSSPELRHGENISDTAEISTVAKAVARVKPVIITAHHGEHFLPEQVTLIKSNVALKLSDQQH